MPKRRKAALGSHLEKHGSKYRVVVRVPPSLVPVIGKTKLKETLNATTPQAAEVLKWPAIARLKQQIAEAKAQTPEGSLVKEALDLRREYERQGELVFAGKLDIQDTWATTVIEARRLELLETKGPDVAALYDAVATGQATPFEALRDDWLREKRLSGRAEAAYSHALRELKAWCADTSVSPTIEAISKRVAGRFIHERFVLTNAAPATANKAITALSSYWKWLEKRGHYEGNPWAGQSLSDKARGRRKGQREPGEADKRPFTEDEAQKLLEGITDQLLSDFCHVAALTGMRRDEIANLKVKHIQDRIIKVPGTKTAAAVREVPVHPDIEVIFARRTEGKAREAFIFDELPEQTNPARGRGAPVSQSFTRKRRALGVDDTPEGARQSRVDFHSWRRWFIRQAVNALEEGATGFTAWTIADVVGHSKEDGPLPMTMGRYPGKAPIKALRACVEAVQLPKRSRSEAD